MDRKTVKIDMNQAIKLYRDEKLPSTKVAKIMGCSIATLISRLREYGINIRKNGYWNKKVDFEIIKYEYETLKMSTTAIAQKHNMSPVSVWERLNGGGVKLRDQKEEAGKNNRKIPKLEYPKICQRYLDNLTESCGDIAKDYGVHKSTISNILKKCGIELKSGGPRSGNWKGGITPLYYKIRNCEKDDFWRRACMERDDYKCCISGETNKLQVHHYPKTFSKLFDEFLKLHKDLDPIKDCDKLFGLAQNHEPFWDINNGMTVSESTHKRLHTKNGISDEELIELHDKGWSCERISRHFGKSPSFTRARFLAIKKKRRDNSFYNKQRYHIDDQIKRNVLEAYIKGEKTRTICSIYKISHNALYRILKENNINPGNRRRSTKSDARQQSERVTELHNKGVTIDELKRIYNVSDTTIRNILKETSK